MEKIKVGIIFGGKSGEHEVSIVSATSIRRALNPEKYDVTMVGIDKSGRWTLPDERTLLKFKDDPRKLLLDKESCSAALVPFQSDKSLIPVSEKSNFNPKKFDVILPIMHGTYGEDGTIQGLLELANVPYVGSGVLGSALGMDKDIAKRVFQAAGVPVVPWIPIKRHEFEKNPQKILDEVESKFGFPFFVKPANMGSSVGVHKVNSKSEAMQKVKDSFLYDTKILCEKGIAARELEISVLGNNEPKASIIGEIIPTHEFYSYEAKYLDENGAILKIPAENISKEQTNLMNDYAIKAFKAIECRGLARVDFFVDKNSGEIYLNEINTMPGFTSISMYPKLWAASGIDYPTLLDELIKLAIERHEEKISLKTSFE